MKVIVLENLRSLHNVGSILRTADGAGWNKVYLTGYTGCPPDRRIEKVSLGAEEFLAWEHNPVPLDCVQTLKAQGYKCLALEQTSQSINLLEYKNQDDNVALIVGNEVEGVSPELLKECDEHLEIPMRGQKGSLNVSIAAGIALYQL
ncbi:RNA methyltransferase [bacterium]|nr:RNA methyltransferase [bacterium]NCQ54886.1 RNA methyltransferase [Candidatus Parcubacteria bacterium]NCS66930.1 RNA methyltransferase [Candidatus Peregrinibacteria bacterium]NCS95877.1 RNA methyltransferase [bacterium]